MSAPLSMPTLDDVASLRSQVEALSRRQDATERLLAMPSGDLDLDRVMGVIETARAIGKSPVTLRHWLGNAQSFDRMHLGALMRKDPTGHWISSPRLVAKWKAIAFRALQEVCR